MHLFHGTLVYTHEFSHLFISITFIAIFYLKEDRINNQLIVFNDAPNTFCLRLYDVG